MVEISRGTWEVAQYSLGLREERGLLIIHTLDASDPEAIRARHHEFYERYQRKVVP